MKNRNAKLDASARNLGFTAFLCSVLGSLLLEFCIFQLRGKPTAYVTCTLIGLALSAASWRRAAPYWVSAAKRAQATRSQQNSRRLHAADLAFGLLLAAVGFLGAGAAVSGWITPVSVFAVCLFLFPWSRIPLFHLGMLVPSAVIALGAAANVVTAAHLPHPIMLLAAVWVLWLTAGVAWLNLIFLGQQKPDPSHPARQEAAENPDSVLNS